MTLRTQLLLALALLAAVWFGTLDSRKLVKPDEGRYAELAREMVVTGNWITPRLNDIKYFEKPPLQYWATATAFLAFGENEWTARLWVGLTSFLGILFAGYAAGRILGPPAALPAGAILASSFLWLSLGHINTLDMGLAFFLEVAVLSFMLAQTGHRRWMGLAWAGLALAVLSKGIVALVLTGGTLVLYSLLSRDLSPWRRLELGWGLPLFLLIATPWFVAVSLANPEFPRFFFIHEHFERFLTTVHRRSEPAWYFVPILLLGALPWTTLLPQALARAWPRRAQPEFQARRFLLLWCVVVFGFFSASGSKLASYILPMFPALALLIADLLRSLSRRALAIHLTIVGAIAAICLVLAPRVSRLASTETPIDLMAPYAHWLTAAAGLWLLGTVTAWGVNRRNSNGNTPAVLALGTGALLAGLAALLGHDHLHKSTSAYSIATQVKPLVSPEVPFYSVRMYEQTLPFYLQRTVTLVAIKTELAFGLSQEPDKWIPTVEEFAQRWATDPDAFAVMELGEYEALRRDNFPMTEVARDVRRIIVRKPQS